METHVLPAWSKAVAARAVRTGTPIQGMKTHPKKKSATRRNPRLRSQNATSKRLLPVPTMGEMLSEEFMKPLGITTEQLRAALPAKNSGMGDWSEHIRRSLSPATAAMDDCPIVDLALALDRVFGCPDGYFLRLWAGCAARSRAREKRSWLATAKPIGLAARKKKFVALGGSAPDIDVDSPTLLPR